VLWGGGWGGGSTLPEEPPPPVPRHRTQHSKYNQSTSDANHIRQGRLSYGVVANSLQNFFSKSRRKIGPSVVRFSFLKEFGLEKNTIFACVFWKIIIFL
jgi:hypothetical protein